jgi:predicted CoA-binding protein
MKKAKVWEERYQILTAKYAALEKQYEKEFEKNQQKEHMLIQQSRLEAMGEMIANIGHQWRQPLNHLSLLIQDVSEALEFGEITNHYIDLFTTESMVQIKQMSRTINDFQKFYMPNKEKNVFSLGESIGNALSIFSLSLKTYDIHVLFEYRGEQMAYGYQNEFSQVVLNILTNAKRIAVVGLSDNPARTSYQVSKVMQNAGYEIIPVNPTIDEALGVKAVATLKDIEGHVDIVNVFRRSEQLLDVAKEFDEVDADVFWAQLGLMNEEAYHFLKDKGYTVVMDRCIKVEHAAIK